MPLERQTITIPFASGMDTKTDPKQVATGRLTYVSNARFDKLKQIRRRAPWTADAMTLYGGGTFTADAIISTGRDLLALNGKTWRRYMPQSGTWATVSGSYYPAELARHTGPRATPNGTAMGEATIAYNAGVYCVCYAAIGNASTNTTIYADIYDGTSFKRLSTTAVESFATVVGRKAATVKVAAHGSGFVLVWDNTTASKTAALSAAGVLSAANTIATWDATRQAITGLIELIPGRQSGSACVWVISSEYNGGDVLIGVWVAGVYSIATSGGLSGAAWLGNALWIGGGVDPSNDAILLVLGTFDGVSTKATVRAVWNAVDRTRAQNASTIYTDSPTQAGAYADASNNVYAWLYTPALGIVAYPLTGPTYTVGSQVVIARSQRAVGSPVVVNGELVWTLAAIGSRGGSQLGTFFQSGSHAIGRVAVADGNVEANVIVQRPVLSGSTIVVLAPCGFKPQSVNGTIITATGYDFALLNLAPTLPPIVQPIGGGAVIGGAQPWWYDGQSITELGFNIAPAIASLTMAGSGGSLSAGSYQYAATYEWVDALGCVHRSAAGGITSATAASNDKATVTVYTLSSTNKGWSDAYAPIIKLWRTTANGTVFYRVGTATNSAASVTVSFTDSTPDATLTGNERLYTTGGNLDSEPAPAPLAMTQYRGRLVMVSAEKPNELWYSKTLVPGQALEMSSVLIINVDDNQGDCTAVAALDDKLIIGKPGVIYYLSGQGPDDTGGSNDFSQPIIINTNSGITSARSVATVADGVFYRSEKGFYLLDRALNDKYIGADVEAWNSQAIIGCAPVPQSNEVRFALSGGSILQFDYLVGAWCELTSGAGSVTGICVDPLTSVVGYLIGGALRRDDEAGTGDGANAVAPTVKTGWLGAGELGGYQRVWDVLVSGTYKAPHTLTVTLRYDYDETTAETHVFTVSSDPVAYQYRVRPGKQKSRALKIEIGLAPSGNTDSAWLSALSLTLGTKAGVARAAATKTA